MEFSQYIKNKRVAIVGSSSHLIDQKQGNHIDSYDVIVRISNSSALSTELAEDYGYRLDVLYTWHPLMRDTSEREKKLLDVKYVFLGQSRHRKAGFNKVGLKVDSDWLKNNKIPYEIIANKKITGNIRTHLTKTYKIPPPHGGFMSIYHLLQCEVKSLYVTGFNFLRTGTVVVKKKKGYEVSDNTKNRNPDKVDDLAHNAIKEEKIFFQWVAEDDRIQLDDYLQNLRSSSFPDSIT